MEFAGIRKALTLAIALLAAWLGVKYLLPVLLPFALGAAVALAAEPAVGFCAKRIKLPRSAATLLGVTVTLVILTGLLSVLGALAVKQLGRLTYRLPDMQQTAQQGMLLLQDTLIGAANHLPEGIRTAATSMVLELCSLERGWIGALRTRIPSMLGGILSWIPNGALGLGTGLLAGFMISSRLPQLRQKLKSHLPDVWFSKYLPMLRRIKQSMGGWLKAQCKLAGLTYVLLTAGFLLLGIPYGFLWAVPVALVDAIPVLGTGVVLLPWAFVCFLQEKTVQAVGLLALCAAAVVLRRVLEPKMLGKQLGLDPLLTLVFLYAGYRFWGLWGMILAPLLAAAAKGAVERE